MRFSWIARVRPTHAQVGLDADELMLWLGGGAAQEAQARADAYRLAQNRLDTRHWMAVTEEIDRRIQRRNSAVKALHRATVDPLRLAINERLIELSRHIITICNEGFTATRAQRASAIAFQIQQQTQNRRDVRCAVGALVEAISNLRGVEPPTSEEHYSDEAMLSMRRLLLLRKAAVNGN